MSITVVADPLHAFLERWEESRAPRGNKHRHGEDIKIVCSCMVAVLPSVPPCHHPTVSVSKLKWTLYYSAVRNIERNGEVKMGFHSNQSANE